MKPVIVFWMIPGHDICIYILKDKTFYCWPIQNYTQIKHHDLRYYGWNGLIQEALDDIKKQWDIDNDFSVFMTNFKAADIYTDKRTELGGDPKVIEYIREYKPDYLARPGIDIWNIKCDEFMSIDEVIYTRGDAEPNNDIKGFMRSRMHHMCHATCSYIQSPFDEAFCYSFDGMGSDGNRKFHSFKSRTETSKHHQVRVQPCGPISFYSNWSCMIPEVWKYAEDIIKIKSRKELGELLFSWNRDKHDFAGKVMGLSAYGKPLSWDQQQYFDWFRNKREPRSDHAIDYFLRDEGRGELEVLMKIDPIDLAYAQQEKLEDEIISTVALCLNKIRAHGNNLILSGGGSMNVVANERIRKEWPWMNVYVPPNPGDEGLGLGALAFYEFARTGHWPKIGEGYELVSPEIHDKDQVPSYIKKYQPKEISLEEMCTMLRSGEIIGLIQGDIETGPRALGNRSILCDPSIDGMKDTLNAKVKFREWYRPFAPVCRKEDAEIFFETNSYENLESMGYAVEVRHQYRKKLAAITHVDNTARVQTVTRSQNKLMYDLLTEFQGVLLNTSLNVQGKPICNWLKDALGLLEDTGLDSIVYLHEGKLLQFRQMNPFSITEPFCTNFISEK